MAGSSKIGVQLGELGIVLPRPAAPVANYLSCVQSGDTLYVGGHGPVSADGVVLGKVGSDLTVDEGREAARLTALQLVATMEQELGDLDRVRRIVKVFGMVNVAPGFNNTPAVIDGCSNLLVDIFGDVGRHTRSAVGMAELPFGIAVEIELIAEVD